MFFLNISSGEATSLTEGKGRARWELISAAGAWEQLQRNRAENISVMPNYITRDGGCTRDLHRFGMDIRKCFFT